MDDLLLLESLYSDDERMIRDSVNQFVQREVFPKISHAFENAYFPQEFITKCADLGFFGLTLPKEYGGLEASYVAYGLVCQELEKGDSSLRSFVSVQSSLCMYPILKFGSEEQKKRLLPLMAQGKIIGCFGLTEPDSGSDPKSMKCFAKKVEAGYELNGSKLWITNATIADIAIVWANTNDGIRGFLVEKNTKGFSTKEIKHKMSLRASITGELIFDNVFIPDCNLLEKTTGLGSALSCLNQARYGIAWGAIGAAIECFDKTKQYLLERKQFNQSLAGKQLIQNELANMYSEIIKAQCLNLQIGKLKDQKLETPAMISLCKRNACREALKIARSCRNLLGANGISLEYDVIRHMLNLESVYTYEGTDNIHTLILGQHITDISAF